MPRRWVVAVTLSTFPLAWSATVGADLVPPPPEDCPAGHEPRTGHGGPY